MRGARQVRRRAGVVLVVGLVLALAAVVVALGVPGPLATARSAATITVGSDEAGPTVAPGLFGLNHRYPHHGFGSFTDRGVPQARLTEQARRAGVTMLRYPGGTVANTFRWKRAVGPVAQRGCQTSGSDGAPLDSAIGPDDHMAMVEQMEAGTTLVVNSATGTPQEAADWVAYMNAPVGSSPWADLRAEHGHPEPYGVTWWEVGNEPDVFDQTYWMDQHPSMLPLPYPERARLYAYGGTTTFRDQPLTTDCDRRRGAAISDGGAGQVRQVAYPPVAADPVVTVRDAAWERVEELGHAGPDEPVYTLDRATGRVEFGDGVHGAIPPAGDQLRISYDSGPHAGYADFVRAMKAADPDITVCASYQGRVLVDEMAGDPLLDCQVSHPYTWLVPPMDAARSHDHAMMGTDRQLAHLAGELRDLRTASGREVPLAVSEYGLSPIPGFDLWQEPGGDYLLSLSPALYTASQLVGFAELGVPLALKHSFVDLPSGGGADGAATSAALGSSHTAVFGPGPDFEPSATAQVLEMLSPLAGSRVIDSDVVGDPEHVSAAGRYRALATLVTRSPSGGLAIAVVNRDRTRAVSADVDPGGDFSSMTADVLGGPAFDAVRGVERSRSEEPLTGGRFRWEFPAHSLTVLTLAPVGEGRR